MSTDEQDSTVRQRIREWWQEQLDGKDDVDIKELAVQAAGEFQSDPEFRLLFLDEMLPSVVYNMGIAVVSKMRPKETTRVRRMAAVAVADAIVSRQTERGIDWSKWLVHDPISGLHKKFLTMRKEEVLAASKERYDAASGHLRISGLLQLLAGRMNDMDTVGDKWTPEQLDDIVSRVKIGRPRVSLVGIAEEV